MFILAFFTALAPFEIRAFHFVEQQAPFVNRRFWRAGLIIAIGFFYFPAYWSGWANIMRSLGSLMVMLCGVFLLVIDFLKGNSRQAINDQYNAYNNQNNLQQSQFNYQGTSASSYNSAIYSQ